MLRLHRLGWNVKLWWGTRRCNHPEALRGSVLIDSGRRKMWWCNMCERAWFS